MRIVLCYPVLRHHVEKIRSAAPDCEVVDAGQDRIVQEILDADIYVGHAKSHPLPWGDVVQQGRLKWIQSSAAGLDHCLPPEVIESEILVTSASGLFAHQVAEQTMALTLGLLRSLPVFFRAQQAREFIRRPTADLRGSTVGIVGFGGNGRRIADVLAPWDVRLVATDMFPHSPPPHLEHLWHADRLDDLLSVSDIVILCVPLNEATRKMIGRDQLRAMKPGSLLINVARGAVVDESALIDALAEEHLAGAGLDVTEVEPPSPDSRLWELPNVLITPHVGAQSSRRIDDTTELVCDNLRRYLSGQPLRNLVDKRLGFPRPATS